MKIVQLNSDHNADEDLLAGLYSGDVNTFAIIYRKYSKELYQYARKNISTSEDCEEIIQDVFESLWNRRMDLHIVSLSSYLFSSVRYKVIRYYQQSEIRRKYEDHFRFFETLYENSEELRVSPSEASTIIQRCISDLPKRYQDVVQLKVYGELSNKEIASKLSLTPQTVEIYISNAFKRLRGSYKTHFPEV